MNFAAMLRTCTPAAVLIAIRSAVCEPPTPRWTGLAHDPWWQCDPNYATASNYVEMVVPW